ncbi:MAG: hypothetical protein RR049_08115, partial [Angelakisella sp.]
IVATKGGMLTIIEKRMSPPASEVIQPSETEPTVGIPQGSLPSGVANVSDLKLMVYETTKQDSTALDAATNGSAEFTNKINLEISLVDTNKGNAVVQPNGKITICIPYPDGTNSKDTFTILHIKKDGSTEEITPERIAEGLKFEVSSLSPFAIGWTEYTGGGGGGGNGGGSGSSDNDQY